MPRSINIGRFPQHELSLAVVAQAARFQNTGKPDFLGGCNQVSLRVNGSMRRDRNFKPRKQSLFRETILRYFQRRSRRPNLRDFFERFECAAGNVSPVEGDDIAARCQLRKPRRILEIPDEAGRYLRPGRVGAAIQKQAAYPERISGQREHAPQLARSDDTDAQQSQEARGSGLASTALVCAWRKASRAVRTSACSLASIAAANSAAFFAPAAPIAKVATGTPLGICAIESNESMPFNTLD